MLLRGVLTVLRSPISFGFVTFRSLKQFTGDDAIDNQAEFQAAAFKEALAGCDVRQLRHYPPTLPHTRECPPPKKNTTTAHP